jgi:hypothetical protein
MGNFQNLALIATGIATIALFTLLSARTLVLSWLRALTALLMLLVLTTILALRLITSLVLSWLILPWLWTLLALLVLLIFRAWLLIALVLTSHIFTSLSEFEPKLRTTEIGVAVLPHLPRLVCLGWEQFMPMLLTC